VTPLTNPIRTYAWGSRTAIAALQGRPVPSAEPEAEVWMGAHPSAPSLVSSSDRDIPLTEVIARDPVAVLGSAVVDRFGARLPYLLKILAAARPLSLQAHPNAAQARAGFAAETHLAGDDPGRNYSDPYHKPELLVVVEPFEALCGFRDPETSAAVLESFGVPDLEPVIAALRTGPEADRLRRAVELFMGWPEPRRPDLVAAMARAGRGEPGARALATRLGREHPGDVGVGVALLLNHLRLRPDEAVFMPAGNLHAYLGGVGLEVMAASDNVLRGGLTPKRVDVAELLRVLRYEVLADPVVRPKELAPGVLAWPVPASEFALVKAVAEAGVALTVPGAGPRIVACLRGPARLSAAGQVRLVGGGEAVFLSPREPAVELSAGGADAAVVFQASPGAA
jgi:mannose-6-phosphate isomerase